MSNEPLSSSRSEVKNLALDASRPSTSLARAAASLAMAEEMSDADT